MDLQEDGTSFGQTSNQEKSIRIDLHCHSAFSNDSILTFDSIVEQAARLGLFGVAITDHDKLPPRGLLERYSEKILLIPGCEISTAEGHLLAFGIKEKPERSRSLVDTIEFIEEQGGIPILAHPFRMGDGVGTDMIEAFPDVLFEGMNGRSWMRYNHRASELGNKLGRRMTGGSDAHELSEVGRAWTEFPENVQDLEDVLESLRSGTVEPGGTGLSFTELVRSKAKGTVRWTYHYLGRKAHLVDGVQADSQGKMENQIGVGKTKIGQGKKEVGQEKKELGQGKKEVGQGKKEIEQGKKEIGQEKKEIGQEKKEVGQEKKEVGQGKKEVGQGKKEIEQGKDQIEVKGEGMEEEEKFHGKVEKGENMDERPEEEREVVVEP